MDSRARSVEVEENRLWLRTLSAEKREAIRSLHQIQPAYNFVALFFISLWLGAGVVLHFYPTWPVRVAGYFVIGTAIHSLAILMHEASHGNLFRNRRLDRWSGFLFGAPALLGCTAYRVTHLQHHRHVRTPQDPEEFTNLTRQRWIHSLAFYVWALIGALTYIVLVPLNAWSRGNRRNRMDIALEYGLLAVLYALLFLTAARYGFLDDVLHCLVIPWAVVIAFTNARGWAEHAMTVPGHPLTRTRVITSNRLVSLFMCNTNYHLEHHLYPSMPWYNLRKLHDLLGDEYRQAGIFIETSYFRFLWQALRVGVHGQTRRYTG